MKILLTMRFWGVLALMGIWAVLSWFIAEDYYLSQAREMVARKTQLLEERSGHLAESLKRNLDYLSGIPEYFTQAVRVRRGLARLEGKDSHPRPVKALTYEEKKERWSDDPVLADLSHTLSLAASNLNASLITVVDTAGDCIAASNIGTTESTVGATLTMRDMLRENREGKRSSQFAVGKTTHVPGLYFSSPVMIDGRYAGSVVAKVDMASLYPLTASADVFVADRNGVVILAKDKTREMNLLPGFASGTIPQEVMEGTYGASSFPVLKTVSGLDPDLPSLMFTSGRPIPYLLSKSEISPYGLTVYAESDLPALTVMKHERNWLAWLIGFSGEALIVLMAGMLFYIRSIRHSRNDLRKSEAALQRITRIYAALSQCNQAIVRCSDEIELFPQICSDAVEFGGMKMAWIGMREENSGRIRAVASYGEGTDYLDGIMITTDADSPFGKGPTGTSMRENRPVWCHDFLHDPSTAAWHERGNRFGWRVSAALPLHRRGKAVGTFTLYSAEPEVFDEAGRNLLVEMASDISSALERFSKEAEQERTSQALDASERKYRHLFESGRDALMVYSADRKLFTDANQATLEMFGIPSLAAFIQMEVTGLAPIHQPDGQSSSEIIENVISLSLREGSHFFEWVMQRADRQLFSADVTVTRIDQEAGASLLINVRDVSFRKRTEERIQYLAQYDQLTDLPNRLLLQDRFRYAMSLAQRSGDSMAVLFLDLDHFKGINDSLGHSIGDLLLVEISRRLKAAVREEDTIARLGGDEFILILPGTDANGAAHVVEKLLKVVSEPVTIEQHELMVTTSVGIALYPDDGSDMDVLWKNADVAMYQAKRAGRNGFRFFTQEMQKATERHLLVDNALRHALAKNQFQLHYQPQISAHENRIVGAEALLRWHHPELGTIPPGEFIPIAEDSGIIIHIGEWVLRSAALQMRAWREQGLPLKVMAVNLSAVQFRKPELPELITGILEEVGLPAEFLELELTEAASMSHPQEGIEMIHKLHERGIRLAIDDFGTGYSSLSYLKQFKVYKLKIDQSFMRSVPEDPENKAIVTAIINMANSLGMHTIAEGVETASQFDFLKRYGCDEAQGNFFSPPLPPEQFEAYVRKWQ